MNHFEGITPEQRWRNDVLNELRLIRKALEHNAQVVETQAKQPKQSIQRRGRRKGVVNQ